MLKHCHDDCNSHSFSSDGHQYGGMANMLLTPPLFHPNFGVFPLDQIAHVGVNVGRYFTLFGREITFEVFQPM